MEVLRTYREVSDVDPAFVMPPTTWLPIYTCGVSDTFRYDPSAFRKHFKDIGRAYREQATTLIEMCRLYVDTFPQTYFEDDDLQK